MRFPGRSQRADTSYDGVAWGRDLTEPERPLVILDAERTATPARLALVRAWFREVRFDELEPVGTLGRRFRFEGAEWRIEESYDVLLNPGESEVKMFCVDPLGRLHFLRPPRPTNTATGLTDAVTSGRVEGKLLVTEHGARRLRLS